MADSEPARAGDWIRTVRLWNYEVLTSWTETGAFIMQTVTIELPEEVFSALRRSPKVFAEEMRLAAAIHWYSRGEISQEKAAQIAGLTGPIS